jgi:peptidoglycan/LPS O-acetylase OafA/YrhL
VQHIELDFPRKIGLPNPTPLVHKKRQSGQSGTPEPLIRPFMPELDTLRGVAVLGVLLYHGLYWNVPLAVLPQSTRTLLTLAGPGRLGVDLFFVLSGFLITGILLRSRTQQSYYKKFYLRRALRIFPAYLLILLVLIIFRRAPLPFVVLSLAYLSNLTTFFGVPIAYPVLWSLAVEEHFYFLWPFLARRLSKFGLMAVCVGIIVLSPVSRLVGYYASMHKTVNIFLCNEYTWNALDGLACGAALSIWLNGFLVTRRNLLILSYSLVAIAVAMWGSLWPFGIALRRSALGAALEVVPWHFAFTAMLGFFLLIGTTEYKWLVQNAPLRFLGQISYGLYLCHLLFFDFVDFLSKCGFPGIGRTSLPLLLRRAGLACSAAIFVAYLSRKYFEGLFLTYRNHVE